MTNIVSASLARFRRYQKERFPVVVLLISLIPAVISSGAVVGVGLGFMVQVLALIASVAYLLHIRIIDEQRDFAHDSKHHTTRPIQAGIITMKELRVVDMLAVFVIVATGLFAGATALALAIAMLAYSFLAGKEFFLGEKLRRKFFLYNAVNLVQMLLMQVFVYAVLAGSIPNTPLVWAHFLFTTLGTLVFEFLRKVKLPGEDGTGNDTYTARLGFARSLALHGVLSFANVLAFLLVMTMISANMAPWISVALFGCISTVFWTMMHVKKRSRKTEQTLQLSFLLQYGVCNLCIGLAIILA